MNTVFLPVLATVLSPGASSNLFFHRVLLATSSSPVRQTCIHKYNVIIQHLRQQHLRDQIVFDFTTTDARTLVLVGLILFETGMAFKINQNHDYPPVFQLLLEPVWRPTAFENQYFYRWGAGGGNLSFGPAH